MKTLDRYIVRIVVGSFLLALAALLAIFSVVNLMQELEDAGTGSYQVRDAVWFVLLTLPTEAYELFPAAALLGGVNALGMLAVHNELIAMWASGLSRARLVGAVMQAALLLVLVAAGVGEWVAAPLAQQATTRRSVALSEGAVLSSENGFWLRDGARYVNVRTVLRENELRDVYVYDFADGQGMSSVTHADAAVFEGKRWKLHDLVEGRFTPQGVMTERAAVQTWERFVEPAQLRLLFFPPEYLSVQELMRSMASLRQRGENPHRYQLAFWKRVTMPAVTAVMMFLSLPFVLVLGPSMRVGKRIAAGALAGIGFQMVNQTFGQFGLVYGLGPLVSSLLPATVALVVGVWLMYGREA